MNNITGCMNTKQGKTKVCDSNGIVCNYDQLDEKKECCKYNNNKYACNNDCDTSGYTNDDCVCCGTGGINSQKATILVALFIYISKEKNRE
jgi:hypothetical protein